MMVSGTAYWAMITGNPRKNNLNDRLQWSFDLCIDEENKKKLLDAGMRKSFIKNKGDERGDFIQFTRDAIKSDGTPGKPFEIVDDQKQPWDGRLIGNGSKLNVVVALNERSFKNQSWLKPSCVSIQVWELVRFVGKDDGFKVKDQNSETDTTNTEEW